MKFQFIVALLLAAAASSATTAFQLQQPIQQSRHSATELNAWFNFGKRKKQPVAEAADDKLQITTTGPKDYVTDAKSIPRASSLKSEEVDVCIIGAGVSGLAAAITIAEDAKNPDLNVVVLEATSQVGGRVQSETTEDGFVLDQGFAVFIDQYPVAKKFLDFEALQLKPFLPGALVKLDGRMKLARVADPLRNVGELVPAVLAPVGGIFDKTKVLPLIANARKSVKDLFQERETDTLMALKQRWGFSEDFINKFYKPFLEGIYLAPLEEQSSRMFSFIFKMFSEGSATLPKGGMGQVSAQLAERAAKAGVTILTDTPVSRFTEVIERDNADGAFLVESVDSRKRFSAKTVIVATDGAIAQKLLTNVDGFESLDSLPEQPQRNVGCLYYTFEGPAPVEDPILVLNGIGEDAGTEKFPANNLCFPSVVNDGYAPEGYNLCSVTVLDDAMEIYKGRPEELDAAVRQQISKWFTGRRGEVMEEWELKKIFYIPRAQPGQLKGPFPANVNGGRAANTYREKTLPEGLFVCGDHMATATLNGALESGDNAGAMAAKAAANANKQAIAA